MSTRKRLVPTPAGTAFDRPPCAHFNPVTITGNGQVAARRPKAIPLRYREV